MDPAETYECKKRNKVDFYGGKLSLFVDFHLMQRNATFRDSSKFSAFLKSIAIFFLIPCKPQFTSLKSFNICNNNNNNRLIRELFPEY